MEDVRGEHKAGNLDAHWRLGQRQRVGERLHNLKQYYLLYAYVVTLILKIEFNPFAVTVL